MKRENCHQHRHNHDYHRTQKDDAFDELIRDRHESAGGYDDDDALSLAVKKHQEMMGREQRERSGKQEEKLDGFSRDSFLVKIDRLNIQLARERATVRALQDRLIKEEEKSASLRRELDCRGKSTLSSLVSTSTFFTPSSPKMREKKIEIETKALSLRPPWNNDTTADHIEKDSRDSVRSESKEKKTQHDSHRRRPRRRPQWNNDFTSGHVENDREICTDEEQRRCSNGREQKCGSEGPRRRRPQWNNDFIASGRIENNDKGFVAGEQLRGQRNGGETANCRRPQPRRKIEEAVSRQTPNATRTDDRKGVPPREYETVPISLKPCPVCMRTFRPDSLKKHVNICKKNAKNSGRKKPKQYSSAAKRAQAIAELNGIDQRKAKTMMRAAKRKEAVASQSGRFVANTWKRDSESLRENLRAARQYTARGASSIASSNTMATRSTRREPNDYVPCPHCGRTFNPNAAQRHIPHCKKASIRKRIRGPK